MTAKQPRATDAEHCDSSQGREIVALARAMLDTIVKCHEAVLQDDGETLTVIRHVLEQVRVPAELERNVKSLLAFVVQTHEEPLSERSLSGNCLRPISAVGAPGNGCEQRPDEMFAMWFCTLSQELIAAHPQAAQMLRLRLLGLDSRHIADRLQLPPRLVRHLFHTIGSGRVLGQIDAGAVS